MKNNLTNPKVKTTSLVIPIVAVMFLTTLITMASDWPQYRGSNQDCISPEKINVWPPEGPKLVWKVPMTNGYGSFSVSGDKVFGLISREIKGEMREMCVALDAATGKELWVADVTSGAYNQFGDEDAEKGGFGPRSTPTVNDGKVYVYSVDLKLCCFDAQTGKELWRVDVLKDHAGRVPHWGSAESPVVDGDLVFVAGGGSGESFLAINKNTGQVVWKTDDALISHATPVLTTMHGERQVVFFLKNDLLGISVKDGKRLWRSTVPFHTRNTAQPLVFDDKVYCGSANYSGGGLYQIIKKDDETYPKRLWFNSYRDTSYVSTPVLRDGYLYGKFGVSDRGGGFIKCIEFATGKVQWEQAGFGSGSVILIGDKLVFLSEHGELLLVEPKPDAYTELARFKALEGKCFGTPAFSNGRIYIRSNKESACYDMDAK